VYFYLHSHRDRDLLLLFLIRCDFIRRTPETLPDSADLATGNGRENKLPTFRKISAFFIYILCTQCERNYLKYSYSPGSLPTSKWPKINKLNVNGMSIRRVYLIYLLNYLHHFLLCCVHRYYFIYNIITRFVKKT